MAKRYADAEKSLYEAMQGLSEVLTPRASEVSDAAAAYLDAAAACLKAQPADVPDRGEVEERLRGACAWIGRTEALSKDVRAKAGALLEQLSSDGKTEK
jgi:hypothetical protein